MRAPLVLAAVLAVAPAHAAGPARVELVTCAPGYPGTTAEAQPNMDAFAGAVARAAGWAPGAVAAVYEPTETDGVARIRRPDAAAALVPLPFLVEHGAALGLVPRLQIEMQGRGLTEQWTLVAKKGRIGSPAGLAGFTLMSIAGYSPGFVRGVLAPWGPIPESTRIVASAQILSALRKAASGESVAVLLDGEQGAALPGLPFAGELEVVARSAPLPAAFVAPIGRRLPPARWEKLERALIDLAADPKGAEALEGLRMARFVRADPGAVAAARRLAQRPSR